MVAGEEDGVEVVAVHPAHHGKGVAGPAAEDADLLGQGGDIQVAGRVVGVLDEDLLGARGDGSFAGGADLPGHLTLEGVVVLGGGAFCFAPVGDAAGAFNVGGEKDFHG